VLGFAGAPFTLAAYLVEGSFRKSGDGVRRMLYGEPALLHRLLETLADATSRYLVAQAEAGAGAVQLFDTWAGILAPREYREFALPYAARSLEAVHELGTPTILYVNGSGHLLDAMAESGASALSVDWRVPLPEVRRRLGPGIALQGNLDPAALCQPAAGVRRSTRAVLDGMGDDPGYIFNLGHGILPDTPVESVEVLVETLRGAEVSRGP
jgi:uroporphyrinogen decarboxylase